MIRRKEKLILCFKKILEHWVGYNKRHTLSLVVDYEVFHISVILWSRCNEIESKIVNCRMSHGEKRRKKKVKIKTQNEKIETDRDTWH